MTDIEILQEVRQIVEAGHLFLDIIRIASTNICERCVITLPEYKHWLKENKNVKPVAETIRYWVEKDYIDAFVLPKEQTLTHDKYLIVMTNKTKGHDVRSYAKKEK